MARNKELPYVYLAQSLTRDDVIRDPTKSQMVVDIKNKEVFRKIIDGEISHASSIVALVYSQDFPLIGRVKK